MFTIYALTLGEDIVYVGQTRRRPELAISRHRNSAKKASVRTKAFDGWRVLDTADDQEAADVLESWYIGKYDGPNLQNMRAGRKKGALPGRRINTREVKVNGCGNPHCVAVGRKHRAYRVRGCEAPGE